MNERPLRVSKMVVFLLLACCHGCTATGGAATTIGESVSSFSVEFSRQALAALLT